MNIIDKSINHIVLKIKDNTDLDGEKLEVIKYGVFAMVQIFLSIIAVIIFGFIFNVLLEAIIVSFTIAVLRKSSGGVHATTPEICLVVGTAVSVLLGKISINTSEIIYLVDIAVYILTLIVVIFKSPMQSKNKPIGDKKKKRLKKKSILITVIIISLSSLLLYFGYQKSKINFIWYANAMSLGMLWQAFSLTKIGEKIMGFVDFFLNKYIFKGEIKNEKK
ncbi:accessory gene regulator B family protein [Clostridium sp. LY3-2]|uniref:accessory gene regulator ArgB-like protein n=1 Tax=Clostridium sp. LY3-2 TaxID=2942482 RepID=UPI00215287A8|nr:accessory gene regulator B family protein [Clostridium sp. LY3-2]MCR6515550.1 accessory gene regulator B family protein [Clostridium sp. LY3-2]